MNYPNSFVQSTANLSEEDSPQQGVLFPDSPDVEVMMSDGTLGHQSPEQLFLKKFDDEIEELEKCRKPPTPEQQAMMAEVQKQYPGSPFNIAASGKECYLIWLANRTGRTLTTNDHDREDFSQSVILHVMSNWKHYRLDRGTKPHSFIALMVRQAASRIIDKPSLYGLSGGIENPEMLESITPVDFESMYSLCD